LAAFFALLLIALSAVPVLASEPIPVSSSESPDFTPPTPEEEEIAAAQVPGPEEVSKAIGEYERKEREHEAWLASPEATLQREHSRRAYTGLSATETQGLLRRAFPRELEALNNDPSRYLSDAHLVATLGASGAVVKSEGEAALLETTVPLRTEDEEGKLAKVDLSLEATVGGFETANAVSNVRLPGVADKGIEVGEEGVEISQQGAAASGAQHFGDKNLFYPSVLPDTDLMASATSFGAELYDLLRSEESPEDLRFHIAVPDGAELRSDGHGGAEVLREGERLTLIPKPSAKDAQGTDIPLQTEVEGGSLVVHVPHHADDYAYPILVDPIVEDWVNQGQNWYGGNNWGALSNGAWKWDPESNSDFHHDICCWEGSHAGLLTIAEPVFYGPEQFGQWAYSTANEHVYIPHVWLIPFNRADNGCTSQQPHDYAGLWNPDTKIWSPIWINYAKTYGNLAGDGYGQALIIGEGSGPPGVWLACQRILYAGGVGVWLEDWDAPVINSVSGMPSGWIKKDATQRTINVTASDEGLGVQSVRMISPGSKEWNWNQPSCTGLYGNRCANTRSGQITYETGGFPFEGEVPISVQGIDPTGKGYNPQNYTLFVDGTSPTIKLSGQLAGITHEEGKTEEPQGEGKDELSLPTYNLKIEAEDGNESQLRSGVKEIAVYLDESQTPAQKEVSPGCPQGSCPLTMDYALHTIDLTPGEHTLKIVAVDWAGNEVNPERKIKFEYIPATGMKEEYVLQHIPLPDGQDHSEEAEPHGPEIAVNVMNGNLVYHERDVDVQTPRASLELERFYNSQQPEEKDTQWGHGWSITQSPELRPEEAESPPQKATMTKTSAITSGVNIPSSEGESTFSSRLHAEIDKGTEGYEVSYKGGAEVSTFAADGRIEETRYGDNSPLVLEEAEELLPGYAPTYDSSFGSSGTGNGQFNHPAGSTVDAEGDIWVVDENNDRVQEFDGEGEYLSSFGSSGSGDGQFGRPTDIAIDAEGHLWVTDAGNSRIEEFSANGEYLSKFGSYGTGNGQFHSAETLAIDAGGSIWVGDTYNGRLEKFTGNGEFVKVVGSKGSGQGQMIEPTGVAIGPDGNVWVADWGNQRVAEFSESGEFVRQFGSAGTGDGQFQRPDMIDVDTQGNVWVGDQNNDRIQRFNQEGDYVEQFGATGSGEEQFNFGWPMGLTTDAKGNIWVSDTGNNRVQRWTLSTAFLVGGGPAPYNPAPVLDYSYSGTELTGMELTDPVASLTPRLSLDVTAGLVSNVEEEEGLAPAVSYEYEAGNLIAKQTAEEEATFTNDGSGRLKRIELANGTWAEITYDSLSRATAVTVDPAGAEEVKTTHFWYGSAPRETKVWGGGNPEVTYSIGEDGSVFKWAYTEVPPAIDSISGSLWANRNSTTPIENKDHALFVTGSSPHEIASVQILVNGNAVVAEKTCEDPGEPPEHNCEHVTLEWITNAAEHAPGQLNLEAVVTDFLGHSTAERFFVTIPVQPPTDPEAVPRPSFDSIKLFREEYGLDRTKNLTEEQLNRLILELLYEWERQDPSPMKAVEKWGVPMRTAEVEEMEFRERYINQAAKVIPEWGEEHALSTYGGYYVDNRSGGTIYVGFTENQHSMVESMKESAGLLSPESIAEFPVPPKQAVVSLEATEEAVVEALASNEAAFNASTAVEFNNETNLIEVGANNQAVVSNFLTATFGSGAPIRVYNDDLVEEYSSVGRYKTSGKINAGDSLVDSEAECTAGFGARRHLGSVGGAPVFRFFTLTAGHCFAKGDWVFRAASRNGGAARKLIGTVLLSAFGSKGNSALETDAAAVDIDPALRSGNVFFGDPRATLPMRGVEPPRLGYTYCWSGINGGTNCGPLYRKKIIHIEGRQHALGLIAGGGASGDSGGPVWNPYTQKAVGIISLQFPAQTKACHFLRPHVRWCPRHGFTPLLPFRNHVHPIGVEAALDVNVLRGE